MGMPERKAAVCGVCPGGCGIIATVEGGKLVKVEPDRDHAYGDLCLRGKAAPEVVYSPDRLKTPLIRTGKKGRGEFRVATWDEAIGMVVGRMKEIKASHGAQALAYYFGRGAFEQSLRDFTETFLFPFGSPNVTGVISLCFVSFGILAPIPTFGVGGRDLVPDVENSKTIVVWGANPITDSPPFMFKKIVNAQKRGAKVIAIDHMVSDIAKRADRWVAVRSGTDGALALGMIRVIINEGLYDKEFVEKWTVGFDELKDYVQQFTLEEVERITWVPGETVLALAREIATTRHVSLQTFTGLEYTNSGVQNLRAVFLLWALAGHLDVPGGLLIAPPGKPSFTPVEARPPRGVKPIGTDKYPLFAELTGKAQYMELPDAVLRGKPYPVKGVLINGSSTLTSYPQPEIWEEVYGKLDFLAVIDLFMTSEALYADVVLPAATYFEISSYQRFPDFVRLREPLIMPVGQARNSFLILAQIAHELGFGDLYPQTEEAIIRKAFAKKPDLLAELKANPAGVRLSGPDRRHRKYELGVLRPDGRAGFNTPSGKVEIASSILARHGYDALPVYADPVEGPLGDPELHRAYPLVLNTGARMKNTFRSQHLNIPKLVRLQEKPFVLMNPMDAKKRGIANGDKVIVRTQRGQVHFWADVSDRVLPGAVEVNMGGGSPIQVKSWRDSNTNILTDFNNRDPISGFPVFKALLCEVERA